MTRPRRWILLSGLVLLALLDAGRSLSTRLAARAPTRLWPADPPYARPLAWPPGSDLAANAPLGAHLYAEHCAICHGTDGRGNGPAAPSLHPRPRDFTGGVFKLKSTPGSDPPTRADVHDAIRRGMPGSSMPAWDDLLSAAEVDAVAEWVRNFGPHQSWADDDRGLAVPPGALVAASAERGQALYSQLGCTSCHGEHGRGDGSSATELKDVWSQPDRPRDLTAPWTFRAGASPAAVYTTVALGFAGTPMPGYAEVAEPQQIADVVAYLRSIARTAAWEAGGTFGGPGQDAEPVRRGEYLVHAGMCGLCHTPVDSSGIYLAETHYLAGGMKVDAGAHGVFFSRNLTPDAETGLGNWSVDQIAIALRTGHTRTRRLNFWGMPWMVLGQLSAEDARAMAQYLKTLKPVRNQIPEPLHYGVLETALRKFTYGWPAMIPPRLAYFSGNYGYEESAVWQRDRTQGLLILAQKGVLILAVLALLLAPSGERGGGVGLAVGMFLAVAGALLVLTARYPALNFVPTEVVVASFSAGIPEAKTDGLPTHTAALLQRGRYLYGISSCAYCHNGDGAGGGKVNWSVFGTTWAANLTTDPTGLATWSDAAVLRAMISGVRRDGRTIHWQAMIWDHISNYDPEDQHALLAYLRTLPPVEKALPKPVVPQTGDCRGDTFWVGASNRDAGCR